MLGCMIDAAMPRLKALLVEDDERLAALVREYLEKNEIDVTVAGDGERGLALARRARFDVVLLDLMLPGRPGLEVCRELRAAPDTADVGVIMLTARGDDVDKVVGLEMGADDYVAKPFNPRELLARVRAVARRAAARPEARHRFRSGDLEIDYDGHEVTVRGERRALTHHEFAVLAVLARAAGRVLSRDQILEALGGDVDPLDRSIDVHISKLRAKLEENVKDPKYIKTVRGVGYVLAKDGG
jgi:DNA-binding response OmpR family regulator